MIYEIIVSDEYSATERWLILASSLLVAVRRADQKRKVEKSHGWKITSAKELGELNT